MKTALRMIAAVLAGLLVSFILVVAVELGSNVVHPFPDGVEQTPEEICRHVANYPHWILAVAVLAWAVTALVGAWIAGKIGNFYTSAIVGLLLLAGLVLNLAQLPYPLWFKIVSPIALTAAIIAGSRLATRHKPA